MNKRRTDITVGFSGFGPEDEKNCFWDKESDGL